MFVQAFPQSFLTTYTTRCQDEDGTLRDGKSDGFNFESQTVENAFELNTSMPPQRDAPNESLQDLRLSLKNAYPLHEDEIDNNALLWPSRLPYPDTESNHTLERAYTQMVRLREMDKILQNAQRQGRISFYMTCTGEEAIHIGAASALTLEDTVLAQYREAGLLMWRGFTLTQFTDQCFGNKSDLGKGRQMPIHYGSKALNYQTISSPLGTQIPQAVGSAYRLKLQGKKAVAACFFGEGCSSTTDFHSGLNFAATLGAPVIFFCRNNGYAISTPVTDQYRGDGVISRAPGYGMAAIRVDGNDIFAVHAAVREARYYAIENQAPVLIEAMSYRQGHHSTSDDSLSYRSADEVEEFGQKADPLSRIENFMKRHTPESVHLIDSIKDEERAAVIAAMQQAEKKKAPDLGNLFSDVYSEMPPSLVEQHQQLREHLSKYPDHYESAH